jgi:hypothetical protein
MTLNHDKSSWSGIGRWIVNAYKLVREPVCYILVIASLVASVLQNQKMLLSSLAILLGIVVRILFEVHEHTEPEVSGGGRFRSLADARDKIEACLRSAQEQDGFIRVQWMGMTMYNVWNTMEAIFDSIPEKQRATLSFEVAMLDSAWLDSHDINATWKGPGANDIASKILNYRERNQQKLAGQNWDFKIHRYSHMPALHGGLINEKYLFMGIARWEDKNLKAGDRTFYFYSVHDSDEAREQIELFKNWFHYSFDNSPDWTKP